MRRALLVLLWCCRSSRSRAFAQISVYDPAVTARNTVTAVVKEFLLNTQREQHSQLRRMAQRLSLFTNLREVRAAGPATLAHARRRLPVHAGVQRRADLRRPSGAAYLAVSHPVAAAHDLLARLTPGRTPRHARRVWRR